MENQFDQVMRKRSDADLVKILNGPSDDYQPEAFEAAKNEFERRNLSETDISGVKQQIVQEQLIDEARANAPLSTMGKILPFIFPGIILLMFAGTYKADGYDRKARELVKWTLWGFAFYFGIAILIIILSTI